MSYYFYIRTDTPLTHHEIMHETKGFDIRISNLNPSAIYDIFDSSFAYRYYHPGKSSRGVAVTYENGAYDIGLNVLASREDYKLGIALAQSIAKLSDSLIEPEEYSHSLKETDFKKQFNKKWIDQELVFAGKYCKTLVSEQGASHFPGCIRRFYFGQQMIDSASKSKQSELKFAEALIEQFRQTQYIDTEKYLDLEAVKVEESNGQVWKYIEIDPDTAYVIPEVDYVLISVHPQENMRLPIDEFIRRAAGLVKPLDEVQYLCEPVGENVMRGKLFAG